MWFKNLQIYRLSTAWKINPIELSSKLTSQAFAPAGKTEMQSQGWASPRDGGELAHQVNRQILLQLRTEKKLLPSSVINQLTKERLQEIEEQQGYKPGRKLTKEIKEQVTEELMPRAFSVQRSTFVWIDPVHGWLVVDASNPNRADDVVNLLLKCDESIPLEVLRVNSSPVTAMTGWLASHEAPAHFTIDQDTELRSNSESKATVRYVRHTLDSKEIADHISEGKQCTRLALTWQDRVSFILTENLTIKRVQALEVIEDPSDAVDAIEQMDNDFVLMCGELNNLITDLIDALGGESDKNNS